ncbi:MULTISPECIES: DUF1667 domain-containing protein [Dictyoglomus]|jgi:CxxC motif-containing protein|uniref:DUF1667 domain-containing protein n=1 Tax=Dictyoglomus turgidum (strain DSM 6724 / Z-1310) TaxID=515635 RepID=B8DYI2_DICTD|nr:MULTISPECIES: DUF1667 domain-containing protein [Dictyoglomus]ACK41364.1 protein of unknown function DUF1667 [Dictyoglomus turgidum DSM 6724]PNV80967.1 MAG: DUF1667 domain-containing protein [Dictyoglomus turgidum]HBU31631.1 DUF1667 domain-containing protein [Dictyoglomus sp.]
MKKNLTCIVCPLGCHLEIEVIHGEIIVKGNKCERGKSYAEEEIKSPKRVLTTTVKIKNGKYNVVPVKTTGPIPKDYLFELLKKLADIEIEAPVPQGFKVLEKVYQEVDVVTTRSMEKREITKNIKDIKNKASNPT